MMMSKIPKARRRAILDPYRQAQVRAMRVANRWSSRVVREVQATVQAHSARLAKAVGQAGSPSAAAQINLKLSRQLAEDLRRIVNQDRTATFQEIQAVWRKAVEKVAGQQDIPNALMGAVRVPVISLLGAYEQLGSGAATWKTLLGAYAGRARLEVDAIVKGALAQGVPYRDLARGLQPYMDGSQTLRKAFGHVDDLDLRKLRPRNPALAGAAKRMRNNALRVAFSEGHNARAEAEVMHFAADPLVRAVAWRLSPDRGTLAGPDECDALAMTDFYGLGEGVYPLNEVPFPPHPWDRCERVPVVGTLSEMSKPKPLPARQRAVSRASYPRMSKPRRRAVESNLQELLRRTHEGAPGIQELLPV